MYKGERFRICLFGNMLRQRRKERLGGSMTAASPNDDGNKVLAELANKRIHQVPVVKDGKIQGIVSRTDILHFLQLRADLGV